VSATTVKLLRAAAQIAGGERVLAERLGISQWLLQKFAADVVEIPDMLLLHVVDIILAERHSAAPARKDNGSSSEIAA
jgi:hypothetical protein